VQKKGKAYDVIALVLISHAHTGVTFYFTEPMRMKSQALTKVDLSLLLGSSVVADTLAADAPLPPVLTAGAAAGSDTEDMSDDELPPPPLPTHAASPHKHAKPAPAAHHHAKPVAAAAAAAAAAPVPHHAPTHHAVVAGSVRFQASPM
jgi:hypothetical protein